MIEAVRTSSDTQELLRIVSERCDRGFLLFKLSAAQENLESKSWNYAILDVSFVANHLMEAIDQFQFGSKSLPKSYKEARIDRNADFLNGFKENFTDDLHFILQSEDFVKRGLQACPERSIRCVQTIQDVCSALGLEISDKQ